jgi:alkanesulfonate monooxygenase SsuD/methylene tetrahydromethanopterin reductase-like flavin-dependent oxidoreductase (luciferase family)
VRLPGRESLHSEYNVPLRRGEQFVFLHHTHWEDYRERAAVENKLSAAIVGSNSTVKAGLEKLRETGADEVIVVTDTYEHADRLQSFRRLTDVATMIEATGSQS